MEPGTGLGTRIVDDKCVYFHPLPPWPLPSFLLSLLLPFPPPKHYAFIYFNHLRLLSGQRFVITAAWCIMSVANLFPFILLVSVADTE